MSIADDVRKKLNSKDKEIPEYFSDDSETQRKITFNVDDLILKNSNTISLISNIIGIIYNTGNHILHYCNRCYCRHPFNKCCFKNF